MPLHMPFNFPYFYNNYNKRYSHFESTQNQNSINKAANCKASEEIKDKKSSSEAPDYFFEIFGLKLYFDDILIICILFFLYKEDVHDEELFLCLILLLLS